MTTREVVLDGGSPWGFRLHGGADLNQPLRISRVNPGSKAALRGIREGDFITSINGQSTKDISNAEAHSLLKNSGETLKLGLNEDQNGSPKRRQYKTVHQETHSETVKRSSITSYTLTSSKIVSQTEVANNDQSAKVNGNTNVNGDQSKNLVASQRSTLSSNCSSSASSTPSTYTQPGSPSLHQEEASEEAPMADNALNTRTRRKRSRNSRKRNKNSSAQITSIIEETKCASDCGNKDEQLFDSKQEDYRVESPKTVKTNDVKSNGSKMPPKSKSLDDDEMVKIQELSEVSEGEDKECKAVISEAESDIDWESTENLDEPEIDRASSSMSLPLKQCTAQEISLISPEDELTLRNFLETLNLVNSPEDAAKQVYETNTIENIKARKARKRAELEQYFAPIAQNPRYLDVISEENSDLSDREQYSITHHLKQGTPELEIPEAPKPPLPSPSLKRRDKAKKQNLIKNPAILVGAKIIDQTPVITHEVCSSNITPLSEAEVVYLEDSSNSTTPDPKSEHEVEDRELNEEVVSSGDSSVAELFNNNDSVDSEVVIDKQQVHVTVKKNNTVTSKTDASYEKTFNRGNEFNGNNQNNINREFDDEVLSQLTPPPTPDNTSPKSETIILNVLAKSVDNDVFTLIKSASSHLSDGNYKEIRDIVKNSHFKDLPSDIKTRLESYLQTHDNQIKEVEPCDNLSLPEKVVRTIAITPPPPSPSPSPSPSLSSGSSRATSLCTAKYNPMNSSIADIESLNKDEELLRNSQLDVSIPSLRELCVNYLMAQPFGVDVLQELADVALSIENLTSKLSSNVLINPDAPNLAAFAAKSDTCFDINSDVELPVDESKAEMPTTSKGSWVGLPTEENPRLLVCLSPTQKSELEKGRKVSDEARKLLDLHEKFINRSCYRDSSPTERQVKNEVEITSIKDDLPKLSQSSGNNVSNRLLAIIREEPTSVQAAQEPSKPDDYYLFFVANNQENAVNVKMDSARLRARDLSEWLQLARNKSTSESNLTGIAAKRVQDPTNRLQRRTSLPQEFYQQQMQYLLEKERQIQKELEQLEDEKRKLTSEMVPARVFHAEDYHISRQGDFAETKKSRPMSMPVASEFFRQQMYEEYMDKVAAREERKQLKVIKVTSSPNQQQAVAAPEKVSENKQPSGIEDEFMSKVKQKQKMGKLLPNQDRETELAHDYDNNDDEPVLVMDGDSLKGAQELPKHLQEFIDITKHAAENSTENSAAGVWSPGQKQEFKLPEEPRKENTIDKQDEPISPIWTPKSATSSPTVERKEFRPVKFESPVLNRKTYSRGESTDSCENISKEPPWKVPESSSDIGVALSSTLQKRLPTSHSSPASGFNDYSTARLPRVQNPTITLLQKAREGQLPRGAAYIEPEQNRRPPIVGPGEIRYQIKNEYTSESDSEKPRKMADLSPRKFDGIGPVTKDGMPLILRSEVRDANQSKWYKKMYDTIHKQRPHRDEYVTVRYRTKRDKYPYCSGYLSEPEPGAYDSDYTDYKYATLDRRRVPNRDKENDFTMSSTMPLNASSSTTTLSKTNEHKAPKEIVKHVTELYKNRPGRIENYKPGHSSISDKEAKEWWDEVMDIFDGHLEQQKRVPPQQFQHYQQPPQPPQKSFINQALKESGYESDSTLVFRRRDDTAQQLSPLEQKEAYKVIQKGGDIPLHGLRKPAPERPKEDQLEYFPISPTLTRIRIHKNITPQREIICYPVTVHPHPSTIFATYKRSAPSAIPNIPKPPPLPPSPPKRRSSRNNSTLRLISTMKVKTGKSPICKRHQTCFTTTSDIDNTKVKYLRDKITYKLSPEVKNTKESKPKIKVSKVVTSSPLVKSKIVSTLHSSGDVKAFSSKVQSRTSLNSTKVERCCSGRSQSVGSVKKSCKKCAQKPETRVGSPQIRTFGVEKKKVDLVLPKIKTPNPIISSPDLLSPTEVKKAVQSQSRTLPSGTVYKKSTGILASAKNGASTFKEATIPIKVGISEKGKAILKTSIQKPAIPSTRVKNKSSSESLQSPTVTRKVTVSTIGRNTPKSARVVKSKSPLPITSGDSQKLKKSKKEEINGEIVKKEQIGKELVKPVKCAGRAAGTEIVRKLRELDDGSEFGSNSTLNDIIKQKEAIQTDYFFQHLFLRDLSSPTPSMSSKNSWIFDKTCQLQKRRASTSEPTIGAMKVYLKHTKPVSDSKFKSLDLALSRSRSASPKSVTWRNDLPQKSEKRSSSLPPKLIFSQTSRPVSPKVERKQRKSPTPPPSPRLIRSPSSRRIMQLRNQSQTFEKTHEMGNFENQSSSRMDVSLYSCPSLSQSTSSIDSYYDRKEYQAYLKELLSSTRCSTRFKELNEFYSTIEKFGKLEQATSSTNLKPRRKFEDEIIDYDRWKEVRTRERAERELKSLMMQLKEDEKEKGFLFSPKQVDQYRWKRELDRGLRIKEKSVENIKDTFEKLNKEESDQENAKRREIASLKDTYKPLWRGNSVLSLASRMAERRSQSEGRIAATKQRLIDSERILTHGIGSRIWSSLSMEQVNILKNQLSEIFSHNTSKQREPEDYSIRVPEKSYYSSTLTVRRNSDTSDYSYQKTNSAANIKTLSESDKRLISQTISKEVLDHMSKRRNLVALPKETRGAIAAADAAESLMTKSSPAEFFTNGHYISEFKKEIEPSKPLLKTDATTPQKLTSASETESGSTDESTKTVIYAGGKDDIKKKVEYFENVKVNEQYTPIVYKPAESHYDIGDTSSIRSKSPDEVTSLKKKDSITSRSCQDFKEIFGEQDLMKFATVPLSDSRKETYLSPERPKLRVTSLRIPSPPISEATSNDSFYRSRSLSPFIEEPLALVKAGEVRRLKSKFEYVSGTYPPRLSIKPRRCRSDPNLNKSSCSVTTIPGISSGDVEYLRSKYEYPALAGRGRSRFRRGGVVSPTFLRAEDRFMPHINIISKISDLYGRKPHVQEKSRSTEELAQILGCPIGEVQRMRQKFDEYGQNISLLGRVFTSSPNLKELRDIAPYLAASWIAHRYPRFEDNTRSLSSPETSAGSRDTSSVRRDRHQRPKSTSPPPKKSSILKTHQRHHSADSSSKKFDAKKQPLYRYQPEPVRYKSWWTSTHSRPSVSFKEPEPPLPPPKGQHGLRNLQPESPRKYVENEVTIHYKTPVRQEIKEYLSEDELAYRQAEAMKKIYQEERRRKYLQELQDMNSRRHTDNFIPSQKSPIPLNRYDEFDDLAPPPVKPRPRSPEPRLLARALYNFVGQTARELTFRKGDLIYVRRQVDKNWYEGELNAMVGLFPVNYVEIVTYDTSKTTARKSHEGQARAKFNFVAQTHLELSLAKGELVVITRRVDDNWFEGKIGGRKGIFPVSYVEVLIDPSDPPAPSTKPVAAPAAHSLLLNGSAQGKESMGSHSYTPNVTANQLTTSYRAKPVQVTNSGNYGSLDRTAKDPISQALHIETQSEPVPYRAMYKYLPQNDDELELLEGDTVYVLEKCDDGWYVGSSERTGAFGTFPGNYVEKI